MEMKYQPIKIGLTSCCDNFRIILDIGVKMNLNKWRGFYLSFSLSILKKEIFILIIPFGQFR